MGLRPTQRNENYLRRHLRESGGPLLVRKGIDARFRGNDVIFERAQRGSAPWAFLSQSEIPRRLRLLGTAGRVVLSAACPNFPKEKRS